MKNITPRNDKRKAHGYWELYFPNDSIMYKGFYNNGKKVGYEETYYYWNNVLTNKKYYYI